jgi:hypothetical protein
MIKKKDGFHVKTENDIIDDKALPWFFRNLYQNQSTELTEVEAEIDRIITAQQNANLGELTHSHIFGSTYKKGTVQGVYIEDNVDITPLIAKIATFAIFYLLPSSQIPNIPEMNLLLKRVNLEEKAKPEIFMALGSRDKCYKPYHSVCIDLYNENSFFSVSVRLFYSLLWIVLLKTENAILLANKGKSIKKIGLRFLFSNPAESQIIPILNTI